MLVVLNGIPASGKSTLARAWCAARGDGLPLALDVDVLRSMLGGWQEARQEAGLAARAVALAAAGAQLRAGRDVVVPQYLRRADLLDGLERVAAECSAVFVECALVVDPSVADQRFRSRATLAGGADPHGLLESPMASIAADLLRFLDERPSCVRLEAGAHVTTALGELDRIIESARRSATTGPLADPRR